MPVDIRLIKFYLWVGLAYLSLSFLSNLSKHPESFVLIALNEIWRAVYIIVHQLYIF